MKRVKKILVIIAIIFAILLISLFAACEMLQLLSDVPRDYVDCAEYFDENGFQDYTHYCWYQYADTNSVKLPARYKKVTDEEIPYIKSFFDDFQGVMSVENRLDQYDFDQACINSGDSYLLYLEYGSHAPYDNYDLYFFDKETARLYFIHTNI